MFQGGIDLKRLFSGLAGMLLVLALFAVSASANHSNGNGPDFDKVDGTGMGLLATPFGTFDSQIHVNAKRDASGVGATGYFQTNIFATPFGDVTLAGSVSGLTVNANNAFVCGVVEETSVPGIVPVGAKTLGRHIDNGEGSKATAPDADAAILIGGPATPPILVCPPAAIPTKPIDQGNYIVHDGQ
jgi:hypothetical protein